ncbi:MAG: small multi-drug export protein [Candidatus Uhrbacteria bacterium]|nr:small multi-drug export protein [Candidatus Uhrbacteria bacterium]
MTDQIIAAFAGFPNWLAVILLSMIPVTELRATIPVAILAWDMQPIVVFFLALIGNAIPFFPIFFGFLAARRCIEQRLPWTVRWFDRLLARAHRKLGNKFEKYGMFGLAMFVAIPFPGTGVWMGTLIAVALELPFRRAVIAVLGGEIVMGVIVLALTLAGRTAV